VVIGGIEDLRPKLVAQLETGNAYRHHQVVAADPRHDDQARSAWDTVAEICGEDTDDWSGGRIELYATKTQMGGQVVECIRVRAPRDEAAKTATPPKPAEPEADDMNDAIPF
jgi:hypothetical protein